MDNEFIPYEQALELKELDYNEPCFGWFRTVDFKEYFLETELDLDEDPFTDLINSNFIGGACSAPLYQQAFRWFREEYQLYAWVKVEYEYGGVTPTYYITGKRQSDIAGGAFNTYEEAELACLKKLIEIVKNK